MRIEKAFLIIFIIEIVLKLFHFPGASTLLIISLSTMSMAYFAISFYLFCDKDIKRQNFGLSIPTGIFISVGLIGLLFKIQYWPGLSIYLAICSVAMAIVFVISLYLKSKALPELKIYYRNMLRRTGFIFVLTLLFYLPSNATLLKIQYWDNPELARINYLYFTYPENPEYKKMHDDYYRRRDSINSVNYIIDHSK